MSRDVVGCSHDRCGAARFAPATSLAWPPPLLFLAPSRRGEAELFNKQPNRRLGEDEGIATCGGLS